MRFISLFLLLLVITTAGSSYAVNADKVSSGDELGIIILGGIVNTNGQGNVALIKELSSSRVAAVKVGYILLDKYLIKGIERKYILISDRQDITILVYQPKFAREFKELPQQQGREKLTWGPVPEEVLLDGFERKGARIRITQGFRDNLIKNDLSKVLMQATALPYIENNQIAGFALTEIVEGSIYHHAGFQANDIITAINGIPLNDVSATIKLLNGLKGAGSIDINIRRKGQNITFNASID